MNKWYETVGAEGDIVFSVRVRLARNISCYAFPNKMTDEDKYSVIQMVSDAVLKSEIGKDYSFIDMDKISHSDALSLAERHVISPDFAKNTRGRALILKNDESVSVMINEEDHIRIQCIKAGLEFDTALKEAMELEKLIGSSVSYAFDDKFGYLTECPTNLGTGLRASAMVHLPALERINALERLFNSAAKLGVEVRGTFGEGSKTNNSMYQISNQITLGVSEKEAVDNINLIIKQFVSKEKEIRTSLDSLHIENIAYRSFAALKYARLLSSEELFKLLSDVRLGVSMNLIDISVSTINTLNLLYGSNGVIKFIKDDNIDAISRDKTRAKMVRKNLENIL